MRADSDLREPQDLAGRRAARWSIPWFTQEYAGALAHRGIDAPQIVDMPRGIDEALARGAIDVMPTWMDMTLYHRRPEFAIRTIPLDIGVYTTGLIAADRLPLELVTRMLEGFVAGHELVREQPELGIAGFRRRYPEVSAEHIRANWALFEPYAFDRVAPGSIDADRWRETIAYTAATHGLSEIAGERFYRPQLLAPALAQTAA